MQYSVTGKFFSQGKNCANFDRNLKSAITCLQVAQIEQTSTFSASLGRDEENGVRIENIGQELNDLELNEEIPIFRTSDIDFTQKLIDFRQSKTRFC